MPLAMLLPDELLYPIFKFVLAGNIHIIHREVMPLLLVCRRWKVSSSMSSLVSMLPADSHNLLINDIGHRRAFHV
jgi:hypothetical protein